MAEAGKKRMATRYYLGIDIGTTGCKSVVFDESGTALSRAYREYPIVCEEPLQAEQEPFTVLSLLLQTMEEAVSVSGAHRIEGMSLSVQGDATIPVDRDYCPLHRAILGMDYRPEEVCRSYAALHDAQRLYRITGQPLHAINMLSKILWLKNKRQEIFERAWKFVTYEEFLLYHLGGEPLLDTTMASRSMGFDLAAETWSEEILQTMGLSASRLSEVCRSGAEAGTLSTAISERLGLENRPRLFVGGHDQPIGAVGAGVVYDGMALDSTGTAEVLSVTYRGPRISRQMQESFYSTYYHAVPSLYFSFAHMQVGGILQRWYRDNLGTQEVQEAVALGVDFYSHALGKCTDAPSPVLVLPHFNGSGTPLCDMRSLGAFTGLTLSTTRNDILKGILDSLCFELRTNVEALRRAGIRIDSLRAVGGGARSPLWLQTKADVLGIPVQTIQCKEAGCLGAAILAATGSGAYASILEACEAMTHTEAVYLPRADSAARYNAQYDVYRSLYDALKPVSHAIFKLRGK